MSEVNPFHLIFVKSLASPSFQSLHSVHKLISFVHILYKWNITIYALKKKVKLILSHPPTKVSVSVPYYYCEVKSINHKFAFSLYWDDSVAVTQSAMSHYIVVQPGMKRKRQGC